MCFGIARIDRKCRLFLRQRLIGTADPRQTNRYAMMRIGAARHEPGILAIMRNGLAITSLFHLGVRQHEQGKRIAPIAPQHLASDHRRLARLSGLQRTIRRAQTVEHPNHRFRIRAGGMRSAVNGGVGRADVAQ